MLRRPAFAFDEDEVASFLAQVRAQGEFVVSTPLSTRLPHVDDEPFLEVAEAAMVEFLVTGNLQHFSVGDWKTRIVSPRQFLDQFDDAR